MVCPEPQQDDKSKYVDVKDCYFDKDCHAKVEWAKIKDIKSGFFARLQHFKEKKDPIAVKKMMGKVHKMFHEAGVPEDRIDYILVKWVNKVYPESLGDGKAQHEPRLTMCAVAKKRCTKDGEKVLQGRCGVQWKACEHEWNAHLKKKGAKSNYENKEGVKKEEAYVKDCYFDTECHSKVDWEKLDKI